MAVRTGERGKKNSQDKSCALDLEYNYIRLEKKDRGY